MRCGSLPATESCVAADAALTGLPHSRRDKTPAAESPARTDAWQFLVRRSKSPTLDGYWGSRFWLSDRRDNRWSPRGATRPRVVNTRDSTDSECRPSLERAGTCFAPVERAAACAHCCGHSGVALRRPITPDRVSGDHPGISTVVHGPLDCLDAPALATVPGGVRLQPVVDIQRFQLDGKYAA